MSTICYAVKCFGNHIRYTYSKILAEQWAKDYNTNITLAYDIPKYKIQRYEIGENDLENLINQDIKKPLPINHIPGIII